MFWRRKRKLKVDLNELEDEKESFSSFLRSKLKVDVTSRGNKVWVDSENLSSKELKRLVNKFVYRRNLMNKYWVELEGGTIRINKFKHSEKHKNERRKELRLQQLVTVGKKRKNMRAPFLKEEKVFKLFHPSGVWLSL